MKVNLLTQDERNYVQSFYPNAVIDPVTLKPELTPLQYMSDKHATLLCSWCDKMPFMKTNKDEWLTKRVEDKIIVSHKGQPHSYHIDTYCGNVEIFNDRKRSNLGINVYAMQFYMQYNYLFPIFFGPGHWAHEKTASELGVAIIDKTPLRKLLTVILNKDKTQIDQWFFERQLLDINLNDLDVFKAEYSLLKHQVGIAV